MDLLSVIASITAVLQLSEKFLKYLENVENDSEDRTRCVTRALYLHNLLNRLPVLLQVGNPVKPLYAAIGALSMENGPLDQYKQALEKLQTRITEGRGLMKSSEPTIWRFEEGEVTSILARIERLKTSIEIALQMHYSELSDSITDSVQTHNPLQSDFNTMPQNEDSAKHSKLMAWLSPLDFEPQQFKFLRSRLEGTCQWFLDAPEFAAWLRRPKKTLFCPGVPGAGKTTIAAITIDYLFKKVQSSSVGLAYVYCDFSRQNEQDATSLLAAILKQLVQGRPSRVEPIERLYNQHSYQGTRPSLNEIMKALTSVLEDLSTLYVIVDALDECSAPHQFLDNLRELQAQTDLRLMVTSRSELEIIDKFREALKLEVQTSVEDVKLILASFEDKLTTQQVELIAAVSRNPIALDVPSEEASQRIESQPRDLFEEIFECGGSGADESDSTRSTCAPESLFSVDMHSISSGTSFTSTLHLSAVDAFAALLVADDDIRSLCASGIRDSDVGPDRLERNLRRLLYRYWKDLVLEAATPAQSTAVELFQSKSRLQRIAQRVRRMAGGESESLGITNESFDTNANIQRYLDSLSQLHTRKDEENPLGGNNKEGSDESSSSDDDQGAEINEPLDFNLQSLTVFLSGSRAFQLLKRRLQDFVYPKFSNELDRISQRLLKRGEVPDKDTAFLQGVILQLRSVNPVSISVSDLQISGVNKWKCGIEQISGVSWNWWPLQEPVYSLLPGQVYLLWQCRCGVRRRTRVPTWFGNNLSRVSDKYKNRIKMIPIPSHLMEPGSTSQTQATSGRVGVPVWVGNSLSRVSNIFNSSLRSPLPSHAPGVSSQIQATSGNNPNFSQQGSSSNRATPTGSGRTANNASSKISGHVFIGVKCGDEHRIAEINVHGFGDDQFFKELRTEYYKLKGYLRRYFSIWRFKHCDFVKFEKFDYESSVPRYEDLPENNPEYLYIPKPRKPSDPMPPIHPHEFETRFYSCYGGGQRHKHILFSCNTRACRPDNDGLERIPKRIKPLAVGIPKRGHFWGLQARENISFLMVALYNLLLLLLPFIFWFCWLFAWNHPGDLQSASIPTAVVAAVLPMFWLPVLTNKNNNG